MFSGSKNNPDIKLRLRDRVSLRVSKVLSRKESATIEPEAVKNFEQLSLGLREGFSKKPDHVTRWNEAAAAWRRTKWIWIPVFVSLMPGTILTLAPMTFSLLLLIPCGRANVRAAAMRR